MTQVPASSHGGSFNGGTITTPLDVANTSVAPGLVIEPTAATMDDLVVVKIPATYVSDSSFGNLIRAGFDKADPSSFVCRIGLGIIDFTAAAGEGQAQLNLKAADAVGNQAALSSGSLVLHDATNPSLELATNAGGAVFKAWAAGVFFKAPVAPADNALANGQIALWFDQTNGAAKLMLKGKTADGTVVSASVALA